MKIITSSIPTQKKSQIVFLYGFDIGCPSGESYEMGFLEDADTKPSKGLYVISGYFEEGVGNRVAYEPYL